MRLSGLFFPQTDAKILRGSRCKMTKSGVRRAKNISADVVSESAGQRACAYYRASTSRQVEVELTIPSQMRAVQTYCERKGWHLAAEFVELGATATDDNRPEFQKMIERPAMTIIPMMSSWSMRSAASSAMVSPWKCTSASSPSGRAAGLHHARAGRRSRAGHDAPDHRLVRRIPVAREW